MNVTERMMILLPSFLRDSSLFCFVPSRQNFFILRRLPRTPAPFLIRMFLPCLLLFFALAIPIHENCFGGQCTPLKNTEQRKSSAATERLQLAYSQLLVFAKLGQYEKVIMGCKELIAQDSYFIPAYRLLVQVSSEPERHAISQDELERTILFFQDLVEKNPYHSCYHYGLGLAYKHGKNYLKSKMHLEKCIELGPDFWDVYEELIPCYRTVEELNKCIPLLKQSRKAYPENLYLNQALGYVYFWMDDYSSSLRHYQLSLSFQREQGNLKAETICLHYLAYLYMYLNDLALAEKFANQSLRLAQKTKDRILEVQSLELISFIFTESGDYSKALSLCRQAFSISRKLFHTGLIMLCSRTLGVIYMEMGELSKAQEHLEKCLRYYREAGETQKWGIALYWMALLHQGKGDFSKALECTEQGLRIAQQVGFKTGEAFHLSEMGDLYFLLGNYEKTLKFNKQALAITEKFIGKWSREKCLNSIGYVYIHLGEYEKALDYFHQALQYVRDIDHIREEAQCLYNIGFAHYRADQIPQAFSYFSQSLNRVDQSGKKTIKGMNYNRLGDLFIKTGDYDQSERSYNEALALGQEIGQPAATWEAFHGLGRIFAFKKQYERSVEYYKKAVEVIEALRSRISIAEFSSGFFENKIQVYEELVDVLFELHRIYPSGGFDRESFYYAERAKARALLDDLQEAQIDFRAVPASQVAQIEIETLSKRISQILTELSRPGSDLMQRINLWNELEKNEDEIQSLIEALKKANPDYASLSSLEPLQPAEIQMSLPDDKTGIIEYFVGEEKIFIFSCTKDRLKVYRLSPEESRSTLQLVKNYIKLLSSKHFNCSDCEPAGEKLCERLFAPIRNQFAGKISKLIIIPDRDLFYLPFETLVCERSGHKGDQKSRYLLDEFKISYGPSASTLMHIINKKEEMNPRHDLLLVGDPLIGKKHSFQQEADGFDDILHEYYLAKRFSIYPLRYASKEIRSISNLFKRDATCILSREKATEENVKSLPLTDYRIIHFATHSLLDEKHANRSALVLNLDDDSREDGFLQAREIYNAKMNSDLVVLSACQTAMGKIERGEGIQGLTRSFLYAGTRTVLASLWKVDDESTAEFMKYFYTFLTKGKTKQEALCLTKIKMLRSRYNRPYHWAAFILIGDSDAKINLHRSNFWEKVISFF